MPDRRALVSIVCINTICAPRIIIMLYDFQENSTIAFTEQVFRVVISDRYTRQEAERIFLALELAKKYHQGQYRADGSPYAVHPIRVALLCLEYENPTPDVLITALLHDVL